MTPTSPRLVRLLAGLIFAGTSLLLFFTQDPGFTRDESFYFNFAESYEGWFIDALDAPTPEARAHALSREPTVKTWSGNFEHPPLMKILFGVSWRTFGIKYREIEPFHRAAAPPAPRPPLPRTLLLAPSQLATHLLTFTPLPPSAPIQTKVILGPATGYTLGTPVALLAPLRQGQAPSDPTRVFATGRVTARDRFRATVTLDPSLHPASLAPAAEPPPSPTADPALAALTALCAPPISSPTATPDPALLPVTPCLAKNLEPLAIMSESEAMRLPGVLSGGLAAMLTFLLGHALFGGLFIGLLGAGLFLFVPEHFFHAHLACFDMPIVAAQLLTLYAFWRSLTDRRWALVAGLAWGLALLTKHNAFFVPVGLVLFWLLSGRSALHVTWRRLRLGGPLLRLPPLPLAFLTMPLMGLTALLAFWPRLWFDPLESLRAWFGFHLQHDHYMQYWFGQPLQVPPFPISYPFEKSLLTYPEIFTILLLLSFLFLLLGRRTAPPSPSYSSAPRPHATAYTLINGLIPILVIALPSTPIFGGIKHWMTGAPFLALLAAWALLRLLALARLPRLAAPVFGLLVLAHPAVASLQHNWLGTHYYNTIFAGGLQGAADDKLMRIFWGHEARHALTWLNAHAPYQARVYWQDATWGTYEMYRREGWLRSDIRYEGSADRADFALLETLQALWSTDLATQQAFNVPGPELVLAQDGVPYLAIYARPRPPGSPPGPPPAPSVPRR